MRRYRGIDYLQGTPEQRRYEDALSAWKDLSGSARDYMEVEPTARQTPFLYLWHRWMLAHDLLTSYTPSGACIDTCKRAWQQPAVIFWCFYILATLPIAALLAFPWPARPLHVVVGRRLDHLHDVVMDSPARFDDEND